MWTKEIVSNLIELWKNRPELWDQKNSNYHKKNVINRLYEEISIIISRNNEINISGICL